MSDDNSSDDTRGLIDRFMTALSERNTEAMLECVAEDIIHDVNQGGERRHGRGRFEAYTARMQHHYEETLSDWLILVSDDGTRASVEYNVAGLYRDTEEGLPPAAGQTYALPAAMFFAVADGAITRVTSYYNLTDWLTQIVSVEPQPPMQ